MQASQILNRFELTQQIEHEQTNKQPTKPTNLNDCEVPQHRNTPLNRLLHHRKQNIQRNVEKGTLVEIHNMKHLSSTDPNRKPCRVSSANRLETSKTSTGVQHFKTRKATRSKIY